MEVIMTALYCILGVLLILILVYFWLLCPSFKKRDMSFLEKKPIAHRGIHDSDDVAENSLGAFALAVNAGLPIELDVRLTKDLVPVIMHDSNTGRVCTESLDIYNIPSDRLKNLSFKKSGEHVPTLAEVLSLVNGKVPLLIELKGEKKDPLVAKKTAELLREYKGQFAIESFNPCLLRAYRRCDSNAPVGFLTERQKIRQGLSAFFASRCLVNFMFRGDFIAYGYTKKLPISICLAKVLGSSLAVWTVRSREVYIDCMGRFDSIIAERISEITKE